MKKVLLIFFLLSWSYCFSQNEYEHWIVNNYEVNFFCDSVSVVGSGIDLGNFEGFATICDKNTGQILFSSDGQQVWNSQLQQMPNGSNLVGGQESPQAALIVPQPGSNHIFYLFTTDDIYPGSHGLEYSIVDMDKDGGLGDVTVKNVFLDSAVSKVNAVYNIDSNFFWVISYNPVNNNFMSFKVDSNGVDTVPILSNSHFKITSIYQTKTFIKSSPNGLQITNVFEIPPVIGLYSVDKNSGSINLVTFLPVQASDSEAVGTSFSPDNSKVYITAGGINAGFNNSEIYQYNVATSDTNVIKQSRITVDSIHANGRYVTMQMGSDGKIYVVRESFDSISVIDNPNLYGKSCQFIRNKLFIPVINITGGLSNNIDGLYYFANPGNNINLSYRAACNKIDSFTINTARGYSYFAINFGDGTDTLLDSTQYTFKHRYDTAGTYTVKLITASGCNIQDSVTISVIVDTINCVSSIVTPIVTPSFITVYPNPAKDQITFAYQYAGTDNATLEIYNVLGEEVGEYIIKANKGQYILGLNDLSNGVYNYRLTTPCCEVGTGKFVVVK